MKTKLLKIVRNRYSIIKLEDKLDPNSYLHCKEFPIYVLDDKFSSYSLYSKDYDEIFYSLVKIIKNHYFYTKSNFRKEKEIKVWYNPEQK